MKNYSKAAARAARKANAIAQIEGIKPITRRKSQGKKRMAQIKAMPNADHELLKVRCRKIGIKPTRENLDRVKSQRFGSDAGIVIDILSPDAKTAAALWATFSALQGADGVFCRRILDVSRTAKVSTMVSMPEKFEADVSDTIDLRTPEQKDVDAIARSNIWASHLMSLEPRLRRVIDIAVTRPQPMLKTSQNADKTDRKPRDRPTAFARAFYMSISALHEVSHGA